MKVMAIYDVRGIQSYIFKTPKVKDAIGASYAVETIIDDALKFAAGELNITRMKQDWFKEDGPLPYEEGDGAEYDIEVLFIGGGNAYVLFSDKELCVEVNKKMAKYVLEHTYSLQLATAWVEKTDSYKEDYAKLRNKLNEVKARQKMSKPLAALPVMKIEANSGYPLTKNTVKNQNKNCNVSTETFYKRAKEEEVKRAETAFDTLIKKKGENSILAVVHMDGNNMGLRIRDLVQEIETYADAINKMREISYHINHSYKKVFEEMQNEFSRQVIKVLVAGDDITYVCTGEIALSTVEYFCKNIVRYTMEGEKDCENDAETVKKLGFSVCAGITYIRSHFPFSVAYEVAEECCGSAKDRAKEKKYMDKDRVLNFVDFQMCKNIQATDLEEVREKEYITATGETLCRRPYHIKTEGDYFTHVDFENELSFEKLKEAIRYFNNDQNIPRHFAKELRNTYSLGKSRVELLQDFFESRAVSMPDGTNECYFEDNDNTAMWYDALELMELLEEPKQTGKENSHE